MKTVGVEFKKGAKQYTFFDNDIELEVGDYVVVETERGLQFGSVAALHGECTTNIEHSKVYKKANKQDEKQHNSNIKEAKRALEKAQELADELQLDMKFLIPGRNLKFEYRSDLFSHEYSRRCQSQRQEKHRPYSECRRGCRPRTKYL